MSVLNPSELDQLELHELLTRLRRRFGNNIVNRLISQHGGIEGELSISLRSKASDLLAWNPEIQRFQWSHDDVQPLESNQLVTDKLPSDLLALGLDIRAGALQSDPLTLDLLELAHALYPALLLQSEPPREEEVRSNPIRARSIDATRRVDERLRAEQLFPERVDRRAFQGNSTFNEYLHLEYLYEPSELLVHAAWELCLLRGELTQGALSAAIQENVNRIRTAKVGAQAVAPVFLGFSAVEVAEPFEAGGVVVRPYSPESHSYLLDWGQRLERFDTPGIVVEVKRPWTYALTRVDEATPSLVEQFDWDEIRRFGEVLVAGHLLKSVPAQLKAHEIANPKEVPAPPQLRWGYCADPINRSRSHHFSTDWPLRAQTKSTIFDKQSVDNATSLQSVTDGSFQIAVRRLASSVRPYRRWSDSLVDAVIGWEALSGDCKGDVSFRVCSIIAHLISAPGHRRQVRAILKKVYAARSRVVHAGELLQSSESPTAASLAGLVALRALSEDSSLLAESDRFSALCMHE